MRQAMLKTLEDHQQSIIGDIDRAFSMMETLQGFIPDNVTPEIFEELQGHLVEYFRGAAASHRSTLKIIESMRKICEVALPDDAGDRPATSQ